MAQPNFGDVFAASYQSGVRTAQEMQQHADAVVMEEKKMAAQKAMEAARMEALSREIKIKEDEALNTAKYQHDSLLNQRITTFNNSFIAMGENVYTRALKMRLQSADELRVLFPGVNIPNGTYLDTPSANVIRGLIWEGRQQSKAQAAVQESDDLRSAFSREPVPETYITEKYKRKLGNMEYNLRTLKSALLGEEPVSREEEVPKQVPNVSGISQYLNKQASLVSKMLSRATGENYPIYAPSLETYSNLAEGLVAYDQNGQPTLMTSGLNPEAASNALYMVASSHRTGYMRALAEAEMQRKSDMATDKETAQKNYEEAIAKARQMFPLYNQSIGQQFGQRYAK